MYEQTQTLNQRISDSVNLYERQKEVLDVTQIIMEKCLPHKRYLLPLSWFEKRIVRNAASQYSQIYAVVAQQVMSMQK